MKLIKMLIFFVCNNCQYASKEIIKEANKNIFTHKIYTIADWHLNLLSHMKIEWF